MPEKEWTTINVEPVVKEKLKEKTTGDESINSYLKRKYSVDLEEKPDE